MQKKPTAAQVKSAMRIVAAAKRRKVSRPARGVVGRKRIGTKSPTRKSSATGKKPSPRLVARPRPTATRSARTIKSRKANNESGYFPNPRPHREAWKIVQTYTIKSKNHENEICFCVRDTIAQELASFLNKHARPGVEYVVRRGKFGD